MIGVFPRPFCTCGARASVIYGCLLYCSVCALSQLGIVPALEYALLDPACSPAPVGVGA